MPDCEKLSKCLFFNDKMASKPASAEIFKKTFCKGDNKKCARYKVSSADIAVPSDLYPNQTDRADTIISQKEIKH